MSILFFNQEVLKISSSLVTFYCVCAQLLSCVRLSVTLWTAARQAPLSVGCSRQGYWSGLPFPPPEGLPNPRIEPASPVSPVSAGGFFTMRASWEAHVSSMPKKKGPALATACHVRPPLCRFVNYADVRFLGFSCCWSFSSAFVSFA